MKKIICSIVLALTSGCYWAAAQQPTTTAATVSTNAAYVQGVGPGYRATAGSGLNLTVAAGTAFCGNAIRNYAGGTLTLTASATNYVYLNTASNCVPASNTTGFTATAIPIATVVTSASAITTVTDVRTWFDQTGTVTSVGLSVPTEFSVSGSPVTGSGTLTVAKANQSANRLYAGPSSGAAAAPTFRALAPADLPAAASTTQGAVQLSGDFAGTAAVPKVAGLQGNPLASTAPATNQVLTWNGSAWAPATPSTGGGGGTGLPSSWAVNSATNAVTAQPVSGQDAVPLTLAPNAATPTADLLDVYKDQAKTTKALWLTAGGNLSFVGNALSLGASGQTTPSNLQVFGGGGTQPYVQLQTSDGTKSAYLSLSNTTAGVACISSSAPTSDCAAGTQIPLLAQDLGGTATAPKVVALQGNPVASTAPASNQVLTWNGSAWAPATPSSGGGGGTGGAAAINAGGFWTPTVTAIPGGIFANQAPSTTANHPRLASFILPYSTQATKVAYYIATTQASSHCDLGMYNTSGTLIWHTGSIDCSTGSNTHAISGGTVAISPGAYYWATCSDSSAVMLTGFNALPTGMQQGFPANTWGDDNASADSCTAGVLPSSITVSNITNVNEGVAVAYVTP